MALASAAVVVTASGLLGWAIRRWLGTHAHRYADEADLQRRSHAWVPVACALVLPLVALGGWRSHGWSLAVAQWALGAVLLTMAAIDIDVRRLPDRFTKPLVPVSIVATGGVALVAGAGGDWVRALLGGVALGVVYLVLALLGGGTGLGLGDVKLAPSLGVLLAFHGWSEVVVSTVLAFVSAGAVRSGAPGPAPGRQALDAGLRAAHDRQRPVRARGPRARVGWSRALRLVGVKVESTSARPRDAKSASGAMARALRIRPESTCTMSCQVVRPPGGALPRCRPLQEDGSLRARPLQLGARDLHLGVDLGGDLEGLGLLDGVGAWLGVGDDRDQRRLGPGMRGRSTGRSSCPRHPERSAPRTWPAPGCSTRRPRPRGRRSASWRCG